MLRASSARTLAGVLALGVALCAVAPAGPPLPVTRAQEHALAAFQGEFVLAGDRRELRAMDDSINQVVDQLNLFIREIARGEIHRRIDPEQRIRLEVIDGRTLGISIDRWGPVRAVLGGPPRQVRDSAGETVALTVRFQDGRLVQRTVAPRGSRTNVFTLSPDLERLYMQVRIASDQLPAEIRYRLTYRRVD